MVMINAGHQVNCPSSRSIAYLAKGTFSDYLHSAEVVQSQLRSSEAQEC